MSLTAEQRRVLRMPKPVSKRRSLLSSLSFTGRGLGVISRAVGVSDRSVYRGSALPDRGLLLDDFANDPTVTFNEITNRKKFTELEYQFSEPEDSDYGPVEGRPDWSVLENEVNVNQSKKVLEFPPEQEHRVITTTINEVDNLTYHVDWQYPDGDGSSGDSSINIMVDEYRDSRPENGYRVWNDESSGSGIEFRVVENGSHSTLISGSKPTGNTGFIVEITRDGSGNWEMFVDGSSQGTAQDTTFIHPGDFGVGDQTNERAFVRNLKIF